MTDQTVGSDNALIITERIGAPPDRVFDFLVNPEKLLRWMGQTADITPEPGGRFLLNVNGDDVASGHYVEVDAPRRVVFTWGWEGSTDVPPGSSTVTINLEADGDETVLELRHDGLPGGSGDQHAEGWNHYLPLLVEAAVSDETRG